MPLFLKALFGRAHSYDDLLKESQRLFNPPQVPSDVLELTALFNSNWLHHPHVQSLLNAAKPKLWLFSISDKRTPKSF